MCAAQDASGPRASYSFAQGAASSAWLPLGLCADGLPSSRELSAVLWSVAAGRHCPQWMGLWLSILLQCGQTRVLGQQNSFEDLNQRDLDSTVSPGQTAPQLGSAGEQSHWFGLLLGHCRYELDLPCSVCRLLQAHLLLFCHSHSQSLGPADSPEIPMGETTVRVSKKWPRMLGEEYCSPWVLSVHCRSQRLSWPSVVLGEEQQCRERVASSLGLLVQSVLVCEVQGFFSLTLCSKILSVGSCS